MDHMAPVLVQKENYSKKRSVKFLKLQLGSFTDVCVDSSYPVVMFLCIVNIA